MKAESWLHEVVLWPRRMCQAMLMLCLHRVRTQNINKLISQELPWRCLAFPPSFRHFKSIVSLFYLFFHHEIGGSQVYLHRVNGTTEVMSRDIGGGYLLEYRVNYQDSLGDSRGTTVWYSPSLSLCLLRFAIPIIISLSFSEASREKTACSPCFR